MIAVGEEAFEVVLLPGLPHFVYLMHRSIRAAAFVHYEWERGYFEGNCHSLLVYQVGVLRMTWAMLVAVTEI